MERNIDPGSDPDLAAHARDASICARWTDSRDERRRGFVCGRCLWLETIPISSILLAHGQGAQGSVVNRDRKLKRMFVTAELPDVARAGLQVSERAFVLSGGTY